MQLRICALATGLGDKAVSLVYERVLRKEQLKLWVERCEAQIGGVLDVLEKERAAIKTPYWFGERIGHADIAVACVLRFTARGASRAVRCRALSGIGGPRCALRGAAGICGNRAAAGAAEGVRRVCPGRCSASSPESSSTRDRSAMDSPTCNCTS